MEDLTVKLFIIVCQPAVKPEVECCSGLAAAGAGTSKHASKVKGWMLGSALILSPQLFWSPVGASHLISFTRSIPVLSVQGRRPDGGPASHHPSTASHKHTQTLHTSHASQGTIL